MLYKYDKNQLVFRSVKLKTYLKTITIIVLAIGISSFASYKLGVDRAITGLTEFEKVTIIKKISKLLTGSTEDQLVPMETYSCDRCGHINKDFDLLSNDE